MHLENMRMDSFNPAAMDQTVTESSLKHVQLAPGRFRAHLISAELENQRLDYGHYNLPLHAQGAMPGSHVTLGFVLENSETTSLNGFVLDGPALVVLREGETLDYKLAPHSQWMAFQVRRDTLERLGIDPSTLPLAPVSASLSADLGTMKANLHTAVAALNEIHVPQSPIVAPDKFVSKVFAEVMDQYQAVFDSDCRYRSKTVRKRETDYRLVRQATGYIRDNLADTIQIGVVCAEFGIGWRSLERAFIRILGVTPKRYTQLLRLAEARRQLLQSRRQDNSVAEIATSCGLNHLGRFSMAYRKYFGELPSRTMSP